MHGKRSITADTALRLARYFGTSERFWLNLQTHYDLEWKRIGLPTAWGKRSLFFRDRAVLCVLTAAFRRAAPQGVKDKEKILGGNTARLLSM